jgi:predicted NBD/HSP70 family sugar kinase
MINDAAMQALGSCRGGTMLFLGLGTGLGTAPIVDGKVLPMELANAFLGGFKMWEEAKK